VTISRWTWSAGRLLLIVPLLAFALVGCNSGDECDTCSTDLDCEAGFFCSTFSDDSRRCGSGEGATSCSVR
jgi:hypothetical protein